ncbi:MAG: DnaJ domain-containing protein [Myxococcota bacterium]
MSLAPTEIVALARIIEDLDYYQLLHLKRDAHGGDVKKAYHATSRTFHPDANRHLEGDLQEAAKVISKRVTEAYVVLRDPRRRRAYDAHLQSGDSNRLQLAEAQAQAGRRDVEERGATTPQGRQFFTRAQADIAKRDWASAARNLQTALTFEPGNAAIQQALTQVKAEQG